ncbi:hypothetical protein B0H66DRAFT_570538 [Apodospora peruviana]|uniref:Apple domain-containing protein n=1 Tax=Apodospora peruviana TaxID=516989 RepID=A0AAE0HT31_9PEZI|nr:hypothetical protein B0H66DRAFT_570538 [Apodospora peruviana]
MRSSVYVAAVGCFLFTSSVSATGGAAGCNADNCLRAVRATEKAPRGVTDCGSYLSATVTPATSTIYSTVVYSTALPTDPVSSVDTAAPPTGTPITIQPTGTVPVYASACSGSVRYSSACSCMGVFQGTTTVAAPSTTIYVTKCALPAPTEAACGSILSGPADKGSRQYQVECGLAYEGESTLSVVTAPSYEACFDACAADSSCGAFTFDSTKCADNCQLFGFYDGTTVVSSDTATSGFTLGTARDGTCGASVCGASVLGGAVYDDGYLVACRSSYRFDQNSNVAGSPFTATSFKDCLRQCDDIYACNYMSFDSSKFEGNCAMFSRGGVSVDVLTANSYVDSAKALVQTSGGPAAINFLPADPTSECPDYSSGGTCASGRLTPMHSTGYRYTAACGASYVPKTPGSGTVTVSTLTVNTFAQCLDACDVSFPPPVAKR